MSQSDLHIIDNLLLAMLQTEETHDIEVLKRHWGSCVYDALDRLHEAWNSREMKSITATWSIYFAKLDGTPYERLE